MLLLKSHPEMALKYQFGTSHEDSLTNSKALIQTEKIKANLEIRAKVSMKKPFFFSQWRHQQWKQPGLSVDKKVSFPKHLGYENLAEGFWEERMPLFLPSECCLPDEWRFSHQQEEKPSWKISSSSSTTANVVPLASFTPDFHLVFIQFSPCRFFNVRWIRLSTPTLF